MHEMSIAVSLLQMAEEEAAKVGCNRLVSVTVEYGQLAGIMPEALEMAFEACTAPTIHKGVKLVLACIPLRMRCLFCNCQFGSAEALTTVVPCPRCGEVFGHVVEQGRELTLARMEAVCQEGGWKRAPSDKS